MSNVNLKRKYDASLFESDVQPAKKIKLETSNDENIILNHVSEKRNVFFTGSAGTGKSTLLKKIIASMPEKGTFITASTGIAATNIDGMTLHSFAGIGLGEENKQVLLEKVNKNTKCNKRWKEARILIIDEISMVDGDLFDKLEYIARGIRGNDKPFGGIQLICCGDFLQLPPVAQRGNQKSFCFESEAWKRTMDASVNLQFVYRQRDALFVRILEEMRQGVCSEGSIDILSKRVVRFNGGGGDDDQDQNRDDQADIKATKLFSLNRDVDRINEEELDKLIGENVMFQAVDRGNCQYWPQLKQNAAPDFLNLKVGAQVMLTINLDTDQKLCNGSRGVVVRFEYDKETRENVPVVKFVCGKESEVEPHKWKVVVEGKVLASRTQIPLKLAWALSIHKSQGQTLDKVEIRLDNAFEFGQAYVALSRVTSLKGLTLTSFDPRVIKAHPKVIEYYRQFQ
jgi:ATP-dependent DNA helicase PIF1